MKILSNTKFPFHHNGKEYQLDTVIPCEVDQEVFNHLTFTFGDMFKVTEEDKKEVVYPKIAVSDVASVPTATVVSNATNIKTPVEKPKKSKK